MQVEKGEESMRYTVVYFDTNGCGRLVGKPNDFPSEADALAHIAQIESVHTKPHKVYYRVISYVPGEKYITLEKNGVRV